MRRAPQVMRLVRWQLSYSRATPMRLLVTYTLLLTVALGDAHAQTVHSLECSPSRLAPGDTLRVILPSEHGQYLSIRAPGGPMYMLVAPDLTPSQLSSAAFAALEEILLPATVRAVPWDAAKTSLEPVFTVPGSYEVQTGQNFESDAGSPVWGCAVVYVPSP